VLANGPQQMTPGAASTGSPTDSSPTTVTPTEWISGVSMSDPGAVAERVLWLTVQDDATEAQRGQIMSYLQTDGVGNMVSLNGENIDEKVRGAMSLAMALPSYQLA
jgi:hypothetical protein